MFLCGKAYTGFANKELGGSNTPQDCYISHEATVTHKRQMGKEGGTDKVIKTQGSSKWLQHEGRVWGEENTFSLLLKVTGMMDSREIHWRKTSTFTTMLRGHHRV